MQIIIPMTGLGSRFVAAGYRDIKPLIEVDDKPIIEYVVQMFPGEDDFVFIVNPDHARSTPLLATLARLKPQAAIVVEETHTRLGPVAHTLLAGHVIRDEEPAIVCYCDFFMDWDYDHFRNQVASNGCDGAVVSYVGFHPHLLGPGVYGSLLVDQDGWMTQYREKYSWTSDKMKCHQSAGAYYFRRGALIKDYFPRVLDRGESFDGEYFVSQAYPLMAGDGLKVFVYEVEHFCQWGAPEHLGEYAYWSAVFQKIAAEPRTFAYWQSFFQNMPWHRYGGGPC